MHDPLLARRDASPLSFVQQQLIITTAKRAFLQLNIVFRNSLLYPPSHPLVKASANLFLHILEELFSRNGECAFHLVGGELFFDTFSLPIDETTSRKIASLAEKNIGGILFKAGLAEQEVVSFAYIVQRDQTYITSRGGMAALLERESIIHIMVQGLLKTDRTSETLPGEARRKAPAIYLDAMQTVKEMVHSLQVGRPFNSQKTQAMLHTMVDGVLDNRDALLGLTTLKLHDEYTFAHSVNVAVLAIGLGTALKFDKPQLAALGFAAMMHDIGKVNLPIEVINKPGSLTEPEWEIMRRHPLEGVVILSGMQGIHQLAMVTALEHHQHYDTHGYPQKSGTAQQHPFSHIVAIADAFDAITAVRVYYKVLKPPDEAIRILLKLRGSDFNPMLVKAFANMVGLFPIGTLLRLDTSEIGLVVHQTTDLFRPRVILLTTLDGTEQEEISLLEMARGKYLRTPAATLDTNILKVNINQYFT